MRPKRIAKSIGGDAAKLMGQRFSNLSISALSYGVSVNDLPEVLKALQTDSRFISVELGAGGMGYLRFKKAVSTDQRRKRA